MDVAATIGGGSNGSRNSCSHSNEVFTHPSFRQGDVESLVNVRFIGAPSRTADIDTATAPSTPLLPSPPPPPATSPPAASPPSSKRKSRPRKQHTSAAAKSVGPTNTSDTSGNKKRTKISDSSPQPSSAGRRRPHRGRQSLTSVAAAWTGPPCCVACGGETSPRVCCSACGGEYHPRCLDPPMVTLPPAEGWVCMLCHRRRRRGRRRHSGDCDGGVSKAASPPSASLISKAAEKEKEEECKENKEKKRITARHANATALMSSMMSRLSAVATANGERLLPPMFGPQDDSFSPGRQPLHVGGGSGGGARDMTEQVLAFALETSGKTTRAGEDGEPPAVCLICERVGEKLATCSACEFSFHLGCLEPPLLTLPNDRDGNRWVCLMCTEPNSPSEIAALEMSAEKVYRRKRGPPCSACDSRTGNVQCCQMCTFAYHPRCMDPPRRGIHTNGFTCADCLPLRPTFEPLMPAQRYPSRQPPRKRRRIRGEEAESKEIATPTSTGNDSYTTPRATRNILRTETTDTPIATPVVLTAEDPPTTSLAASLMPQLPGFTSLDFATETGGTLRPHRGNSIDSRDGSTGSSKSYSSGVCDTETGNTSIRDVLDVAERAPTPVSCNTSRLPGFSLAGFAVGEHERQRQWPTVEQLQSSNGGDSGGRCAVGAMCLMAAGGKLHTCGECGNSYHSRCLKRPKTRMAGCVWRCDRCREDDTVPPAFLSAPHGR